MREDYKRLPKDFLRRLRFIVPAKKYGAVLKAYSLRRPTTFRANTLKISSEELEERLENKGIAVRKLHWYKNAFILLDDRKKLTESIFYKQGFIYVQSLSSMVPPLVLQVKPRERVLDITAAPGSKTTQIAVMMENKGEILANDISPIRILKLRANLSIQGVTNVKTIRSDGRSLWKDYPQYFDRTLADVSCSMEGTFNVHNKKSYSSWSIKNIKKLANQSKWILRSAVSATKVGGRIVYSTCTLAPEENEEVIDWILLKEKGNIRLEEFNVPGLVFNDALPGWQGKRYNQEVLKTKRILPSDLMEGFYIAVLRKIKANTEAANN